MRHMFALDFWGILDFREAGPGAGQKPGKNFFHPTEGGTMLDGELVGEFGGGIVMKVGHEEKTLVPYGNYWLEAASDEENPQVFRVYRIYEYAVFVPKAGI